MPGICTGAVVLSLNMESFTIKVLKLSSHKYGDVINLRKFEYLIQIFKIFADARKYDLTSDLRFFRPVMKVNNINNCMDVFDFK